MNVNVASHSGKAKPDELVPSRYALQVGDYEVLVISDGVLTIPTSVLATNADPAALAAWLKGMFMPSDTLDWPLNVVVIRGRGRTILVDAGIGLEYPDFPKAGRLAQRLAAAGVELASVTDLVLTHLHMDHIGGLVGDGLKGLRRDIPIHVAATEVEFWASPDFSHTTMPNPIPPVLRSVATRFLKQYGSQLRQFDEQHEVVPGVVVRRTGGHTPGHSVVRISSGGKHLTFAGDAIFPVGFDHPYWYNGFEHDPEESARVRVELLRELAGTGEVLVAAHLSFPFCRVAIDGDVFRWVPAHWEY
ncbi:MBL fold metallo-hydrolase [Ferrovibrio terrae]|uniref:MBL fold metallo-hydrolase n=1 Tax=Ferrovibrio terrae TaxID=2594003 RepID=A0A516GZZ6_9PROT|nr:MBL fold metallo-hydrolase [Ferrovibrio terrae]QDO97086.1 MBL fold metallo-hydrolase [Ferrovibrio terrae]